MMPEKVYCTGVPIHMHIVFFFYIHIFSTYFNYYNSRNYAQGKTLRFNE